MPNGGSGGTVTLDNDFDMVWTKNRTNDSTNHVLQDSVRGYGDNKSLHPNLTVAQTSTNNITAVNGRTLTIGSNTNYYDNNVAWSWKAGGSKNIHNVDDVGYASAAAAGLTGGTITPSGSSVGTKQGFSIIKYTGNGNAATIPHGLSQTPTLIIKKFVGGTSNWDVWTPFLSANNRLLLNENHYDGQNSTTSYQSVNATTFDVHAGNNDINVDMIAYCWHDVPGLQKFGIVETISDVGYAELGFRPALVIVKNIDGNASWSIRDNKRGPYNPITTLLRADTSAKDFTSSGQVDFLSNGFKIGGSGFGSYTYFYAAWAEAPAFNLYGGQSNAR